MPIFIVGCQNYLDKVQIDGVLQRQEDLPRFGGRSVFVCGGGLGTKRKLKPETFTGPEQRGQISTPSDLASRHLTFAFGESESLK